MEQSIEQVGPLTYSRAVMQHYGSSHSGTFWYCQDGECVEVRYQWTVQEAKMREEGDRFKEVIHGG